MRRVLGTVALFAVVALMCPVLVIAELLVDQDGSDGYSVHRYWQG